MAFNENVDSLVNDPKLTASGKLIISLNVFAGDLERVEALMASIETTADMAADFGDEEAPPMVVRTWRLAQLMEDQRQQLLTSYRRLRAQIVNSVSLLGKSETKEKAAVAVKDLKAAAARERRNAQRRAARAAKKAAAGKPAPSAKTKPKPSQKKAK